MVVVCSHHNSRLVPPPSRSQQETIGLSDAAVVLDVLNYLPQQLLIVS